MKKLSTAIYAVAFLFLTNNCLATPRIIYSVKTKMPATITNIESLPAYYKGYKIDLREGRAELPECGESQTFSVIFTENVDFCSKGNTVRCLKRAAGQPYSWYDLTLAFQTEKHDDEDKRVYTWTVEKRKAHEVSDRIPEHALVVLTNPAFIENLKSEKAIPGTLDVVLPTFVFKENIDPEKFHDTVTNVLIGPALDLDAFHSKNKPACVAQQGSAVITSIATRSL